MKSFKQMRLDGEIKRADSEQIELHNIHVEPGFNPPDRTAQDDDDDEALFKFIMAGGFKSLPGGFIYLHTKMDHRQFLLDENQYPVG